MQRIQWIQRERGESQGGRREERWEMLAIRLRLFLLLSANLFPLGNQQALPDYHQPLILTIKLSLTFTFQPLYTFTPLPQSHPHMPVWKPPICCDNQQPKHLNSVSHLCSRYQCSQKKKTVSDLRSLMGNDGTFLLWMVILKYICTLLHTNSTEACEWIFPCKWYDKM